MIIQLHLDPVGGISGDMFIGAILDCRPELGADLPAVLGAIGLKERVRIQHVAHNNGVLTGSRFHVKEVSHHDAHHHTSFRDIQDLLYRSDLKYDAVPRQRQWDCFG